MDIYRVALCGHREITITKDMEQKLYTLLSDLFRTRKYVEIYIGRNGEFDIFAASAVKKCSMRLAMKTMSLYWCYLTLKKI